MLRMQLASLGLATTLALACGAHAQDWPTWGGNASRNMVSPEKNIADDFSPGETIKSEATTIPLDGTRNLKWVVKLGSQSYGNPTVAKGKVFVGTNNDTPHLPRYKDDRSLLMCFDEKTGKFLWQLTVPKLGTGKVSDWEYLGICSSPTIDGDRVYIVTNRCEVICLDIHGLANGNDGPYTDEAQYIAGPGQPKAELTPQDADILWRFDIREELGVFPHNVTSTSILVVGDRLYSVTSNGVDWSHTEIPAPTAPAFFCLDKNTGKLLGEETTDVSKNTLHCNWSTSSFGEVKLPGGKTRGTVFFGGGDGWLYGFDPAPARDPEKDVDALKVLFKLDCNPLEYRYKDGKKLKYGGETGPSEIIATPVFHNNRVYVAIGQDPEHLEGPGNLLCIDPTKDGDVTQDAKIWQYPINRSISTVAVNDGLLFASDFSGWVYCFNADTGELYWKHDTMSHIWGSPLIADGKVYLGNEDGVLTVFAASKEKKIIRSIELDSPIYSTPVVANGTLYVMTQTHLYAVGK